MSSTATITAMRTSAVVVSFVALLLVQTVSSTEVHINSGATGGGESTSQTSLTSTAAEILKLTTTAADQQMTTTTTSPGFNTKSDSNVDKLDTSDLDKAETKDPTKKLEIIKQIRKINKDGSYTVGYEAGDGTFKIESRDVLGNIKGTYGYVDAHGEIKRVSYNGNNGTTSALKNFPAELSATGTENGDDDENGGEVMSTTLPNVNAVIPPAQQRTSLRSMRRPASLKFLSTTAAPSNGNYGPKSNYIQTIPKRRLGIPSSTERSQYSHYATAKTTNNQVTAAPRNPNNYQYHSTTTTPTSTTPHSQDNDTDEQATPTTIVYAKTVPTQKPLIILRPTTTQATSTAQTPEQIGRPESRLEINHVSKVMVMKSSETSTSKAVHADKEKDRKSIRGNNLRRQLAMEREDHYEAQPQQLYAHNAGEDSQHIYDGATGNLRPLFSTTSRPRVPSIVLAARQRAAQLQNALNSNQAPTTTTEKVYVRPPPAAIQYETTTSEPAQETNYLTQAPSGTVVQIPANQGIAQQATEDQGSIYGQRPAPFMLRQQQGSFQGTEPPPGGLFRFPPPPSARGDQFLRETTPSSAKPLHHLHQHREDADEPAYTRPVQQRQRTGGNVAANGGANYDGDANYQQGSFPVPYQQPNPYGFGYPGGAGVGGGFNFPQRPPVTTRDFEMLLQLLQFRHRFGGGGGFGGPGFGGGYGGYGGPYNPQIGPYLSNPYQGLQQYPRSQLYDPVSYDPRYSGHQGNFGGFRQYSEPQNSVYQGATGADGGQYNDPQRSVPVRGQGRFTSSSNNYYGANSAPGINPYQPQQQAPQIPRGVGSGAAAPYYQPDFSNVQQSYATQASTQQDYLPSEVREDLLYRMLMLAIQNPLGSSSGGGGGGSGYETVGQPPQIGAFSDPIKSVINNPIVPANGGGGLVVPNDGPQPVAPLLHHPHSHHQHHRGSNLNNLNNNHLNEVQTATRKPVRSVQIIGEAEE